jgi:hypothetical protein
MTMRQAFGMTLQQYPVKNPVDNSRLLTFARATQECLPGIREAILADIRADPNIKRSKANLAQLGLIHEVRDAARVDPALPGGVKTVNRLISLGRQQKDRPAIVQKINGARLAIERGRAPEAGRARKQEPKRGRSL